jgi:hypothetical protein
MRNIVFSFFLILSSFNAQATDSTSEITIRNSSGSTTYNISGFYIQQLATGGACNALAGHSATPTHGSAFGAMWVPATISPAGTYVIGANFLYQAMTHLLVQVYQLSGANCVPGAGDCRAAGAGPNTNQWCIKLGVVKGTPVASTAAIAEADDLLLLADSTQIIVTCNDEEITCIANTPTVQDFP